MSRRATDAMGQFWLKVDKTVRHHAKKTLTDLRGAWWDRTRLRAERPVFVVSGSRSGTQMLYKTLTESPAIGSLNREIYAVWDALHHPSDKNWESHVLEAADATDADRDLITRYFYAHTGRTRFVDKNNQHGLAVPYLHALFPDATFVYIKRNPGDTLNSMIEGWGMPERFGSWARDLPAKVAVDDGRYTRWCHYLPRGWRNYLKAPVEEVCAFQYEAIHRAILDAKRQIPAEQWIEVFYEDIVREPTEGIFEIFDRLELPFDARIERHAKALLDKPYDPLFEIRLEKWRQHAHRERIERVLPSLHSIARDMGYPETFTADKAA